MSNEMKENLTQKSTWMRGLYMLMLTIFYSVAEIVLFAIALVQFFFMLFTGQTNPRLLKLGQGIAIYIYQIIQYITFNSDYQSYPFGAWPKGEPSASKKESADNAMTSDKAAE